MDYKQSLQKAKNFADIFQIVKKAVRDYTGNYQAGLLLGLSDLGSYKNAYLGAFYSFDANTIVINKRPLDKVKKSNPNLYNPYIFHVLLHEYIHSLGITDENEVRIIAFEITKRYFGKSHIATRIALNLGKVLPNLALGNSFEPPEDLNIEFISGIDRENTDYIM